VAKIAQDLGQAASFSPPAEGKINSARPIPREDTAHWKVVDLYRIEQASQCLPDAQPGKARSTTVRSIHHATHSGSTPTNDSKLVNRSPASDLVDSFRKIDAEKAGTSFVSASNIPRKKEPAAGSADKFRLMTRIRTLRINIRTREDQINRLERPIRLSGSTAESIAIIKHYQCANDADRKEMKALRVELSAIKLWLKMQSHNIVQTSAVR